MNEVFGGAESFRLALGMNNIIDLYQKNASQEEISKVKTSILNSSKGFFKDYDNQTDKRLFVAVMNMYGDNIEEKWLVPAYVKYRNEVKDDFASAAEKLYSKSVFTDEARFTEFVNKFNKSSVSKLSKDPFFVLANAAADFTNQKVSGELVRLNSELQKLNKLYMTAQMEFEKDRIFYPDANSTLRVAYGNVMGYTAKDAVYYMHYTTVKGIIEKDNPEIFDYDVPTKLKELYANKDFGRYASNGEVPVCFIANNHTTGGNSGSPVLNAEGQLIGINFDRAWEGVASDMAYNPEQSRNISLDVRYVLFIIDKFAGAGYLLNEMKLVE
jgi:hypothetical protein